MLQRRWRPAGILPSVVLLALAGVLFARLIIHPASLIVDGRRPSLDHANLADPRPVGNDLTFLFLPHHLSIIKVISQYGHLPFWDSRGFGGRPLVGNPQGGLFYPPVWAVWWSKAPAALGWLTVGHLIWGGFGVFVLLRSVDQGRWPATVGAGVYLASPFLLAHTFEGHYPHVWSACWYPWAFWAFLDLRAGRLRGLLIAPMVLAMTFLTGHPQEWYLLVLTLSIWTLADVIKSICCKRFHAAGRQLFRWLGVMALSLGLAAVDVVPQCAVRPWLLRGHDSESAVDLPVRYHLQLVNALQLISPTALGGPSDYFGGDNYWETVFSIGFVPLVLVIIAIFRHPNRQAVRGWLVLMSLAIWFACGRRLGLFALLYSLPGMTGFRVPARALFLANLAGAVLAGFGVETMLSVLTEPKDWRKLRLRLGGIMAILVVGLWTTGLGPESADLSRTCRATARVLQDGRFWFAISGMAVLILLGCSPLDRRNQRLAGGLFGLLALVELGWAGSSLIRVAPVERFLDTGSIGAALSLDGTARIKARDTFFGDLPATCLGIEKTNINDVFQLDRSAVLYESLYPVASRPRPYRLLMPANEPGEEFNRRVRQAVFDRMNVQFLVSDRVEPDPPWPVFAQGFWNGSHFVVQRNPSALPRAYVVPHATVVPDGAKLALSYFQQIDARDSVLMSDDPLAQIPPDDRQSFEAARWTSIDPDHPVLMVTTEAPGLLVVADSWMPGWTATVDGLPVPILRGNHAQRVVPLFQPGRHTIAMDYWPPGFNLGRALTMISAVSWALLCGVGTIRRRKPPRHDFLARDQGTSRIWRVDVSRSGPASGPESNWTESRTGPAG